MASAVDQTIGDGSNHGSDASQVGDAQASSREQAREHTVDLLVPKPYEAEEVSTTTVLKPNSGATLVRVEHGQHEQRVDEGKSDVAGVAVRDLDTRGATIDQVLDEPAMQA